MIEIRRSAKSDIQQLAHMRRLFFEESHTFSEEEGTLFEERTVGFLAEHLDDKLISWHAEKDKALIAVAFLEIAERLPHPDRKYGKMGTVLNVYTKAPFRNQGIAGQLVSELIEEAKRQKLDKLELMATKLGYPVYRKMGFREFALPDKSMEKKLD